MTEPGADPRARGGADDTLYAVRREGFADFTYDRLCTRAELWAAIDELGAAHEALGRALERRQGRGGPEVRAAGVRVLDARERLRGLLGMEA